MQLLLGEGPAKSCRGNKLWKLEMTLKQYKLGKERRCDCGKLMFLEGLIGISPT